MSNQVASQLHSFRHRFQGCGGSWHGWGQMWARDAAEVRRRIGESGLCSDHKTIQVEPCDYYVVEEDGYQTQYPVHAAPDYMRIASE